MLGIYLNSDDMSINVLMKRLQVWEKVRGVTVFEALTGFGQSGLAAPHRDLPFPIVV